MNFSHMNQDKKRMIFFGIVLAAVVILMIIIIVLLATRSGNKPEAESDTSTVSMPSDKIRINDLYLGQTFIPKYDIPLNTYENEKFLKASSSGMIYYEEAALGIDVSDYQKEIDWGKVKESGVDFAIIRLGYRGFTEGGLMTDGYFDLNMTGALENGVEVGVYFFSQAISEAEAREEARYVTELIRNYNITYPVVYDWEPITNHAEDVIPRTSKCSAEEVTAFTAAFCDEIKKEGYYPAYYTNKTMSYQTYDLEALQEYDLWYAEYQDVPSFYYHFDIWQYTESGTIDGITGEVDLNLSLKTYK